MKLKSGTLLWKARGKRPARYPTLAEDIECDVAIVGGGIVGALVAYRLAQTKLSVALVDRRGIGEGSTSASTALLMYQLDVGLAELIGKIGKEDAVRAYAISRRSIVEIKRLIERLGVDCGYRAKKVLYLASKKADAAGLRTE